MASWFGRVPHDKIPETVTNCSATLVHMAVSIRLVSNIESLAGKKIQLRESVRASVSRLVAAINGQKQPEFQLAPVLAARANHALMLR